MRLRHASLVTHAVAAGVGAAAVVGIGAVASGPAVGGLQLVAALAIGGAVGWIGQALVGAPLSAHLDAIATRIRRWPRDRWRVQAGPPDLEPVEASLGEALPAVEAQLQQLSERGRLLGEVVALSPVGLAILDDAGHICEVNDAFRALFRLRTDPLGKRPIEVVRSAEVHLVVEEGRATGHAERDFATATSDLVATAESMSTGVLLRVEDITGRRDAQRSRTDFVANVSHELRTPLTAILGYLEALKQDIERIPEDMGGMLDTVDRNARRLRDLFEDLLRLHRLEARRHELPLDPHRLAPLLDEALATAREAAQDADQRFTTDCPGDLVATLNPDACRAIIDNLARNAVAYTPPGGHIEVRARSVRGGVQIEVVDDGIGIARRHHERVFERFYRVDAARSRRAGGTGLGLAIAKHYALACGWQISLESEQGEGTRFTLLLPDA